MTLSQIRAKLRRYDRNAEVIFDAEEPVGAPTDLVMPRRRWFRRSQPAPDSLEARILKAAVMKK